LPSTYAIAIHFHIALRRGAVADGRYEEHKVNAKGWWMSEKLDGVRAYWSGSNFYSRNGNRFPAPDWSVIYIIVVDINHGHANLALNAQV
jgi:hypothetical protein